MKVRVQDYCYGCPVCNGLILFKNDSRVATCRTENCRMFDYPLIIPEQFVEARPLYPTASGIESQEHKDAQRAVSQGRSRALDALCEREFVQLMLKEQNAIGVPIDMVISLARNGELYPNQFPNGIRNGDTFEFAGKRYIALRDELLKPA